jgi:hypothetical protein
MIAEYREHAERRSQCAQTAREALHITRTVADEIATEQDQIRLTLRERGNRTIDLLVVRGRAGVPVCGERDPQ